ncbi:hypothetical protein PCASD_09004 [Puccinia coronata f. sp. avenae]|uniref:Uncharacterized protein n=1 Tax=Puccinia coronata f. sp. avenae TaxID=200324 RepID=A0A2N5UKJ7_9BASI|nr:hypothetical protein PCASD_09004 [Puccinia coronata f. sp. avenae]
MPSRRRRPDPTTTFSNEILTRQTSRRSRTARRQIRDAPLDQDEHNLYLQDLDIAQELGFVDRRIRRRPNQPIDNQPIHDDHEYAFEPHIGSYGGYDFDEDVSALPAQLMLLITDPASTQRTEKGLVINGPKWSRTLPQPIYYILLISPTEKEYK